jgi:hypothetical protein
MAGEPRHCYVCCVFIFQFDEAALAAAIAERFPLGAGHLLKQFRLPEREMCFGYRRVVLCLRTGLSVI